MTFTIPFIDFEIPLHIVVLGVITGLTYSLVAVGLTLVYKTSRVLNLAAGELGALPSLIVPLLVLNAGWPYWIVLPMGLVTAAMLGGLCELLVIRRLESAPRLTAMVATIGLGQVIFAFSLLLPSVSRLEGERYPTPFSWEIQIGELFLGPGQILILLVSPLIVAGLALFLRRSTVGRASRAVADNGEAARLAGIPIHRISFTMWSIAGLLAGVAAILYGPTRPLAVSEALGPSLLLRSLGAAMIGGLTSLAGSFAGGIAIGVVGALVLWNYPSGGVVELVIAILIVLSLLARRNLGQLIRGRDRSGWTFARSVRPIEPLLARHHRVRALRVATRTVVIGLAVLAPLALTPSNQFRASSVVLFALMGVSLVVLTGYSGHVSLGQYSFVGIGAALGGRLLLADIPYLAAGALAVVAGCTVALGVGLPALRVRGLFLAVTTLAFAIGTSTWLFNQDWFVTTRTGVGSSLHIDRPVIAGVDFDEERNYYWLCLLVLVITCVVVQRIRSTGPGRMMVAVRDNEVSATSLAINPRLVKLRAFVISGGIATLAGFMYGGLLINFSTDPGTKFGAAKSFGLVVTTVFGGVTSITGAVLGAVWIEGIPRILGDDYALLSSGFAVILVFILVPGGMASLVFDVRDRIVARLVRSSPSSPPPAPDPTPSARATPTPTRALVRRFPPGTTADGARPLVAEGITVRYGGITAVESVSIQLEAGEILGLMGPNGAGKTTLFDALTGVTRPAAGRILLHGNDITTLAPHQRARRGLGRTQQQALLFADLTVCESVELALERQLPSRLVATMSGWPGAVRRDRTRRARAAEIIELLGLSEYATHPSSTLPTGVRRLVELACVVGLGADVLLLDEPTAGFAPPEIASFSRIIREIRDHLGASLVVIDHDVPMMRSLVDRLYVLDAGRIIAQGRPELLDTDEAVATAYLGDRAHSVPG